MIELLLEYRHNEIKYMFFRDDRFTFVHGRTLSADGTPHIMLGGAFCTREDEYRVDIGCHVALERFCKNLHLDREKRVELHDALDFNLGVKDGAKAATDLILNELQNKIKERLKEFDMEYIDELFCGLTPLNFDPVKGIRFIYRMGIPRFGKKVFPSCQ